MANVYTDDPILIDTKFSSSFKAAYSTARGANDTLWTLRVGSIYWFNPANVGDVALITDPLSGRELCIFRCETANQSQLIQVNKIWSDFVVPQLDSGRLKITLR